MSKMIKMTIDIRYEPRKDDYQIYKPEVELNTIEEYAAWDERLIRSGELTYGDFPEDAVVTRWEIIDGPENA